MFSLIFVWKESIFVFDTNFLQHNLIACWKTSTVVQSLFYEVAEFSGT